MDELTIPCLVSIRNYIALKHSISNTGRAAFSIHTKLHRSKTKEIFIMAVYMFSIHTKLHRSKTRWYH